MIIDLSIQFRTETYQNKKKISTDTRVVNLSNYIIIITKTDH